MQQVRRISVVIGCCAGLSLTLAAQRTWVVDAAAGPGHDFTDLPPALAVAGHGDLIAVRQGVYRGATTDRGVTILGTGAVLATTLRVTGLPLGATFVLSGFSAVPASWTLLECVGNAGRIHLDRTALTTSVPFLPIGAQPACRLERCRAVTAVQCTFVGGPGLRVEASTLSVTGCTMTGNAGSAFAEHGIASQPAVVAALSAVSVARCQVSGGAGFSNGLARVSPSPGIAVTDTDLVLSGSMTDACRAGAALPATSAPAVQATGGTLVVDPTLPLLGSGGAPPIAGTQRSFASRRVPSLLANGAPPGGTVQTDLYAPAGHVSVLLVGLVRDPTATPFGTLWLDPGQILVADIGVVGAGEHRAVGLPLPPNAALAGLVLAIQCAAADPARATVELTNVAAVTVH